MKRIFSFRVGIAVLAAIALALPAVIEAQTGTGTLVGQVLDEQNAALPGATVTVTNAATGFSRTFVSEKDGTFRLVALPVGTYTVKTSLSGFATVTNENVVINVATTRTLPIGMKVATVAENITVTSEAPLVATSPAIGTVVSQKELENLPLNGRQFANLAVLAPGTSLSYNSDPTKPGQLVVALNGGSGRNVNYIMDGGDNTDDTIGGALQNFNLEAVQEFKIQTMQYKAEFGRSSGGVLSVVTKTGTNEFHGSVYGFFRKDSLNSKTETERLSGADKQKYDRKQYGFSFGGPIVKDKVHFFATYEKIDRTTNYTVDSGGVSPTLDGKSFGLPFKDELVTAKATWDISAKQFLQVRYGYQKNADKYGASPVAAPDNLGTVSNKYSSLLVGHSAAIGTDQFNEFVFQYTKFDNGITPDSDKPLLYYPSGFATGQNINTPQTTHQVKYQYRDDFSFSQTIADQRHDFKVGLQYINEPTLGGDFTSGLAGQYSMAKGPGGQWVVTDITKYGGFSGDSTPTKQSSAYLQDDWKVSAQLTLSIGLRYDYFDALHLDQRSNPIWKELSTQTKYNEYYLKDFQGGKGGVIENDKKDWSPRLGFAWDAKGDGRHLIRGGWGRFYDMPYSNATILFPAMAVQSNYGVVYNYNNPTGIKNADGSYYQPGQPLPPNQLPGADIPPPNEIASPTLRPPYSDQASLGYSWQASDWLGLNLEAVSARYKHIPFRFRVNGKDPATGVRRFSDFGNFRLWYGNGEAKYDGVNLGFHVRKDKLDVQGFYTYSKTEGNVLAGADEFRLSAVDHQPDLRGARDQSVNYHDPLCSECFGPLNTDARHKVTFGATYSLPAGFTVAGMFRYRSGLPYNIWTGKDNNKDGFAMELPSDVSHVNAGRGKSFSQFDLRLSKDFKIAGDFGIELTAEVFNVFNEKNPSGYVGNRSASNYGEPTRYAGDPGQGEQRLAQLGVRIRF